MGGALERKIWDGGDLGTGSGEIRSTYAAIAELTPDDAATFDGTRGAGAVVEVEEVEAAASETTSTYAYS
jgi:hypothetical protein